MGRLSGISSRDLSVSKSNQLHVDIFRFFFNKSSIMIHIIFGSLEPYLVISQSHALIKPTFPSGLSYEILWDYVEKWVLAHYFSHYHN